MSKVCNYVLFRKQQLRLRWKKYDHTAKILLLQVKVLHSNIQKHQNILQVAKVKVHILQNDMCVILKDHNVQAAKSLHL